MSLEIKIINATIDIFREKGVKFTMDDIANKLGVSKRTLYENIDSKETLLSLLVDEVFDSIKHQGQEIIEDDSIEDLEKLKRLLTIIPTSYNLVARKALKKFSMPFFSFVSIIEFSLLISTLNSMLIS